MIILTVSKWPYSAVQSVVNIKDKSTNLNTKSPTESRGAKRGDPDETQETVLENTMDEYESTKKAIKWTNAYSTPANHTLLPSDRRLN